MMYPKYRVDFCLHVRGGDIDGYECSEQILGIDDENALEEFEELRNRRRQEQHTASFMFSYTFRQLVRIDQEEKVIKIG